MDKPRELPTKLMPNKLFLSQSNKMSRTLSDGVLSLRFMQNAQRSKQLKEVELQRAEVVDEGKWEVSQAVREAWGLRRETDEDRDADVHEASYLPFLYPTTTTDEDISEDLSSTMTTTTGRRVFKHTSLDVHDDNDGDAQMKGVAGPSSTTSSSKPSKGRIRAHARPTSISSLTKGKATLLKGFDQLGESIIHNDNDLASHTTPHQRRIPKSTARELVFETGNVGVDLRVKASTTLPPPPTPSFLKPAGVDDPKEVTTAKIGSETDIVGAQIVDGARRKSKKVKRKRDQDEGGEEEEEEGVKKKKTKKKKTRNSGSHG